MIRSQHPTLCAQYKGSVMQDSFFSSVYCSAGSCCLFDIAADCSAPSPAGSSWMFRLGIAPREDVELKTRGETQRTSVPELGSAPVD